MAIGEEMGRRPRDDFQTARINKDTLMSNEILYISTYDVHANVVGESISKAWHILQKDVKYGKLFTQPPNFL